MTLREMLESKEFNEHPSDIVSTMVRISVVR